MVRSDNSFFDSPINSFSSEMSERLGRLSEAEASVVTPLLCGLGYLYGYQRSTEVGNDRTLVALGQKLLLLEKSANGETKNIATSLIDSQFTNQDIAACLTQYTTKIKAQVIPLLLKYEAGMPQELACGFAGYLLYMKAVKCENGVYYGERNGEYYPIRCDKAAIFYSAWQLSTISEVVRHLLSNSSLWGHNLTTCRGLEEGVKNQLTTMLFKGVRWAVEQHYAA
ncbi:MAG: hypothetical protein MUE30_08905 [Spirosomaceae bacterium]|jgi:tagaturonate reductase|nr:hypothetical protein [Spirosomataceae bacterium]